MFVIIYSFCFVLKKVFLVIPQVFRGNLVIIWRQFFDHQEICQAKKLKKFQKKLSATLSEFQWDLKAIKLPGTGYDVAVTKNIWSVGTCFPTTCKAGWSCRCGPPIPGRPPKRGAAWAYWLSSEDVRLRNGTFTFYRARHLFRVQASQSSAPASSASSVISAADNFLKLAGA
jgi:hypothetical protein